MTIDSMLKTERRTVLLVVGLIVLACAVFIYVRVNTYLGTRLDEKEIEMSSLSLSIDRNAPTEAVSKIIRDCSERDRFDTLLGNLGTLKSAEIRETLALFDACAAYSSRVKQLSVSEFTNVFSVYKELYKIEKMIRLYTGDRARAYSAWSELVLLETERSTYFTEQVTLQKEIIEALANGESSGTPAVTDRVKKAELLGQKLLQVNATIDALRETVIVKQEG